MAKKTPHKSKKPKPDTKSALNHQQLKFADYYLGECSFNGVQSAMKAGYRGSYDTLCVTASRLLRNPKVAAYLEEEFTKNTMSANEVMARLADHARGSLIDVLDESGEFDIQDARRRGKDHLLKKLKVTRNINRNKDGGEFETVNYEYEIHDKLSALEKIGRVHSLFTDKHELTGKDGGAVIFSLEDWKKESAEKIKKIEAETNARNGVVETGDEEE